MPPRLAISDTALDVTVKGAPFTCSMVNGVSLRCVRSCPRRLRAGGTVTLGYTQRDRCGAKVHLWALLGTVSDQRVTVLLGCRSLARNVRRGA